MRLFHIGQYLLAAVAAVIMLTSCELKELCMDHDQHALKYHVDIECEYTCVWEWTKPGQREWSAEWPASFGFPYDALNPAIPAGVRAAVYNQDGSRRTINFGANGGDIDLPEGTNDILFYNNDTEYIVFTDLGTVASATASTRSRTRPTYSGSPFLVPSRSDEKLTVSAPDMLYGSSLIGYSPIKSVVPDRIRINMSPLVFKYYIRYEFSHGIEYVALSRGAIAGMAASVNLTDGRTGSDRATIIFDSEIRQFGVEATVMSFGVPDYPNSHYNSRAELTYGLNLEVRLKNGKIKNFDFDITDQVARQPQGGVIIVSGLTITDEEGKGSSSGFDVSVDGWGDYEDVPLDL